MMNSGIPTASGYEEPVSFDEIEAAAGADRFYELTRERACELDDCMETFWREIVGSSTVSNSPPTRIPIKANLVILDGLTKLFDEIRAKDKLEDLNPQYRKFAEWLRIEVAATIYHLFLAEDNSAELFAQGKRIHSLIPYPILKTIAWITNPASVVSRLLDLFPTMPFNGQSFMLHVLTKAIDDGIKHIQKSVDTLLDKIGDPVLCNKLKAFTKAGDTVEDHIRQQAQADQTDLVVAILQSERLDPKLQPQQMDKVLNSKVAYVNALDNVSLLAHPRDDIHRL